jgi:hypothetical protein
MMLLAVLCVVLAALATMGGSTPGKVLNLTAKKKDGFPRSMVRDTTSGQTAVLDVSMVVYEAFHRLNNDELRVQAVELYGAKAENRRALVHPPLQAAADGVCRYWYDFIKTELEVNLVKAVFDGQDSISKREEKLLRQRRRQSAFEAAGMEGVAQDVYRSNLLSSMYLTWDIYKVAVAVFKQVGATIIVADGEADPQIAFLCRRYPDHFGVFSDGDILAYGCPRALVGLNPTYSRAGVRESWTGAWIDMAKLETGTQVVCLLTPRT